MTVTITYDETKWKLAPLEPTEEMIKAGEKAGHDCLLWSLEPGEGLDGFDPEPAYKAMLSAVPDHEIAQEIIK